MLNLFDDCSDSGINCALTSIACIISLLGALLALTCIAKIWHEQETKVFELLPLSSVALLSIYQFILNFFTYDIRIFLTGQFLEAISFAFVGLSFILLFFRTRHLEDQGQQNEQKLIQQQKNIKTIFIIFLLVFLGLLILTLSIVSQNDCDDWFSKMYFIPLGCSGFSALVGILFGVLLRNKIVQQESTSLRETNEESNPDMVVFTKLNHHRMLRKQVISILLMYGWMISAYIALNVVRQEAVIDEISCSKAIIHKSNEIGSQVYFFLQCIIDLIPCFVVPFAYYYVPFAKTKFLERTATDLVLKLTPQQEVPSSNSSSFSNSSEAADVVRQSMFDKKNKNIQKKNNGKAFNGQQSVELAHRNNQTTTITTTQQDEPNPAQIDNSYVTKEIDSFPENHLHHHHSPKRFEENAPSDRKTTAGEMAQGFLFNFANIKRTETKEE